jgi:hypothetical protein
MGILSVHMKIRSFVIWIQSSDERRAFWRRFCTIMIPLDVDTRWNGLYLMMATALNQKASIIRFGRQYPEVQALVLTDEDWAQIEIMERVLSPFTTGLYQYQRTNHASLKRLALYGG